MDDNIVNVQLIDMCECGCKHWMVPIRNPNLVYSRKKILLMAKKTLSIYYVTRLFLKRILKDLPKTHCNIPRGDNATFPSILSV